MYFIANNIDMLIYCVSMILIYLFVYCVYYYYIDLNKKKICFEKKWILYANCFERTVLLSLLSLLFLFANCIVLYMNYLSIVAPKFATFVSTAARFIDELGDRLVVVALVSMISNNGSKLHIIH